MATLFSFLFLFSVGFLVWGVVSPRSFSKHSKKPITRKDAAIGFGTLSFILLTLVGFTAPEQSSNITETPEEEKIIKVEQVQGGVDTAEQIQTETKTETKTEPVPHKSTTVNDPNLTQGNTQLKTSGVDGIKTLMYEVTYVDGQETDRKLISEEVTTRPITEVTAIGTKVATPKPAPAPAPAPSNNCDPNYADGCVPIDSDVDCGGGSGNGPSYFYGTARVVGSDIYGLDRDNDGLACE